MDIFIVLVLFIILFAVHVYFKKGFALTFNFLLFSFILIFGESRVLQFNGGYAEFGFTSAFHALINTFLFISLFYLSWSISEMIMNRIEYFRDKVFPILLFSGIFIVSIVQFIKISRANFDLNILNNSFSIIYFDSAIRWFYLLVLFLTAYFLISCSACKTKDWKLFFFILPFIYMWLPLFLRNPIIPLIEEISILSLLVILAFVCPLRLDYSGIHLPSIPRFLSRRVLDYLPLIVIIALLAFLILFDTARAYNYKLIISIFPIAFLILLAIKRIPLSLIVVLNLITAIFIKEIAIISAIPVACFLLFRFIAERHLL